MSTSHTEYLQKLENQASSHAREDFYLWPRTPVKADLQEEIVKRVGVADLYPSVEHSRPARIIRMVNTLLCDRLISDNFSLIDFPCGDAIVLWQLKKAFPLADCYGVDCNKDIYATHSMVKHDGVILYRAFLQHLFRSNPSQPFDLALMLNTYRGWEYAELRDDEKNLPVLADTWLAKNAKFAVVTATETQIHRLRSLGFMTIEMGKGEDDSKMVCISRCYSDYYSGVESTDFIAS